MGSAAVDRFYRIAFRNEHSFWQWAERVVEVATLVRDVLADQSETRVVVFVPQWPRQGAPLRAYVSAGIRRVAERMPGGGLIDLSTVISAAELPPGLTMLLGSEVDEAEYDRWQTWRRCAQVGIS